MTDRALLHMTQLLNLEISDAPSITDVGLENLISLLRIELNPFITDQGIIHLTNLKELALGDNRQITDRALEKLTQLEKLSYNDESCVQHIRRDFVTKLCS